MRNLQENPNKRKLSVEERARKKEETAYIEHFRQETMLKEIFERRQDAREQIENNTMERLFFFSPADRENARNLSKKEGIRLSPSGSLHCLTAGAEAIRVAERIKRIYPVDEALREAKENEEVLFVPENEEKIFRATCKTHKDKTVHMRRKGEFFFIDKKFSAPFVLWRGKEAALCWNNAFGSSWQEIIENRKNINIADIESKWFSIGEVTTALDTEGRGEEARMLENLIARHSGERVAKTPTADLVVSKVKQPQQQKQGRMASL